MLNHPDILAVINGPKPLANFELRKHPEQFKQLANHLPLAARHLAIHPWNSPEGPEIVIAKDRATIDKYLAILHARDLRPATRAQLLGKLFGYNDASIQAFIENPPECNCSKCVGVHEAKARKVNNSVDRWLFQRFPKGKD